ncbi:YbfB/YjiJ family MFS transporter [Cupriavidus necator]|uniref:YbfB/YjiJ family MFS transporter n=1 Tax=Cupriavidus necator TaxID=106590 RepID=UPI003ECF5D03
MSTHAAGLTSAEIDRRLVWRYIFAGLCASLVSIGLARFAFTPLIPELIQSHWFPATTVVYLGAANLAGYVLGALIGRRIAHWLTNERVLRLMMVLISLAFLACAYPLSFAWYFSWRFISGVAGGVVMVLVAGTILPHVPPAHKGTAGGAIFLGLGLGIAGSGTLIPLLLKLGLAQTWIGLAVVSTLLTAASWFAWPSGRLAAKGVHAPTSTHDIVRFGPAVRLLYGQYALMAASAVPPMVFLVDFVTRGLGRSADQGALFWAIYGLGAIVGPPLYGYMADRLRPRAAARAVCAAMLPVLAAFYITDNIYVLGLLTLAIGTFAPGMVPLALACVHELVPHNGPRQNIAWTRASIISAVALAIGAYGFSALYGATGGNHRVLFLMGAALLVLAILADLFGRAVPTQHSDYP